ncbi:MarR family winged helix-turn-helix transcriptional regulator [Sphaerisporangium sp. NPDC005288]|uniref:MarR family winged helix-turn-helix transcriptional regulator n=1 Tax=unclassified Sphaerisporangium TaxID=2630420 RepID=UPI0033B79CC3
MTSPPAADRQSHRSGPLLDHLARRVRLRAETVLVPLGLRPRHLVALTVLRAQGGCSQQSLAATLEMDGTNIVGLLNELETGDLIARRRSPEDRRRHIVELTPAGTDLLCQAECAMAAAEDEVFGALDQAERESLYALLSKAATGSEIPCAAADSAAEAAASCAAAESAAFCAAADHD